MTPFSEIAPKIAKLIAMLATDNDAEALVAARKIRSTLESADHDLNDLASLIATGGRSPQSSTAPPPDWRRLPAHERKLWLQTLVRNDDRLTPWEASFCASVLETLRSFPGAKLSAKQSARLNEIIARAWLEWGLRL